MNNKEAHRVWNEHNPNNKILKEKVKTGQYKFVIHHKDEDPSNNNISNLQKMTHGEHSRLHRLGKTVTKETRKKIGLATKGRKYPNRKSSPLTEEHKEKIRQGNKGKKVSQETRRKLSESNRGKKRTAETKKRISLGMMGNTNKKRLST